MAFIGPYPYWGLYNPNFTYPILQSDYKLSGQLNEYNELSKVYNLNDFNPNEIKMETIKITLEKLSKVIESLQIYMAYAFHTKS